jgi:RHS repeat-associated protein
MPRHLVSTHALQAQRPSYYTGTSYDLDGRVASVDDGKGTTTYSYDTAGEHRGLVTGEDIGVSGAPSTSTPDPGPGDPSRPAEQAAPGSLIHLCCLDRLTPSTEYGAPRNIATAYDSYGWLGAKQRSTNDLASPTLMGVRQYNPATGRFLTTDPIPGGNANTYTYPTDPTNSFDLDGRCGLWGHNTCWHHITHAARSTWHGVKHGASYTRQHILNRHFWEGVEFANEALGAFGVGATVFVFGGPFGWAPGSIIIVAGSGSLAYVSYRSFREAFHGSRHRRKHRR